MKAKVAQIFDSCATCFRAILISNLIPFAIAGAQSIA